MNADDPVLHTRTQLWVDDERPPPDADWDWVKSVDAFDVEFDPERHRVVSLDYTLARGETGEDVVQYMWMNERWPEEVRMHSRNSTGRTLLARIIGGHFPDGGGPRVVLP